MLPIKLDKNKFQNNEPEENEIKKKRTSCSQQALVLNMVNGAMPTNPNAGTIQTAPAAN